MKPTVYAVANGWRAIWYENGTAMTTVKRDRISALSVIRRRSKVLALTDYLPKVEEKLRNHVMSVEEIVAEVADMSTDYVRQLLLIKPTKDAAKRSRRPYETIALLHRLAAEVRKQLAGEAKDEG